MYSARPIPPPRRKKRLKVRHTLLAVTIIAITASYSAIAIARPFAELTPSTANDELTITTEASNLPWPNYGQGAVGLADGTILASHGTQTPTPIASVSKVINALVTLDKRPLSAGEVGPTYTMTESDVAIYQRYAAMRGSVMPVRVGQVLTERQLLEGLLLPSGNNVAETLAIWNFGSVEAYHTYANDYLKRNGFTQTKVGGDASGFSAESVSTTQELIKLGSLAMQHPVLSVIVGQQTATIPDVGTIRNTNRLLGSNGVVGIKTGNNDANRGVFLGATTTTINGKPVTVLTALAGGPSIGAVLQDSGTLLAAAKTTFASTNVVKKDTVLGTYRDADGNALQAIAANDLDTQVFRGTTVRAKVMLKDISYSAQAGDIVGTVTVPASAFDSEKRATIILAKAPVKPDVWYRLRNPAL